MHHDNATRNSANSLAFPAHTGIMRIYGGWTLQNGAISLTDWHLYDVLHFQKWGWKNEVNTGNKASDGFGDGWVWRASPAEIACRRLFSLNASPGTYQHHETDHISRDPQKKEPLIIDSHDNVNRTSVINVTPTLSPLLLSLYLSNQIFHQRITVKRFNISTLYRASISSLHDIFMRFICLYEYYKIKVSKRSSITMGCPSLLLRNYLYWWRLRGADDF